MSAPNVVNLDQRRLPTPPKPGPRYRRDAGGPSKRKGARAATARTANGGGPLERRQLAAVLAVAEELHFGRAAERLGFQQSALSQLIRRVEERLGFLLFDRSSHHVRVTAEGQQIVSVARDALAALGRADELAGDIAAGRLGRLRIGTTAGACEQLYLILGRFHDRRPAVEVRLSRMDAPAKLRALLTGEIDVAFVRGPAAGAEEIDVLELWQERSVVMLSRRHALAARDELSIAELSPYPVMLASRERHRRTREYVDKLFAAAEVEPVLGPPYTTLEEALAFVACTSAWTIVASSVAARERSASVVSIPLRDPDAVVPVSLAWPSVGAGPLARALVGDVNSLRREGAFESVPSLSRRPTARLVELGATR